MKNLKYTLPSLCSVIMLLQLVIALQVLNKIRTTKKKKFCVGVSVGVCPGFGYNSVKFMICGVWWFAFFVVVGH